MTNFSLELGFSKIDYGATETPWNLSPLLYKGGALAKVKTVQTQISDGKLGDVLIERVQLVRLFHELLVEDITRGGSRFSLQNKIFILRVFFGWVDSTDEKLSLHSVSGIYIKWTDYLIHRFRVERNLTEATAYDYSRIVATLLDRLLENQSSLSKSSRIRKPRSKRRLHAGKIDKQNLEKTFQFGHSLIDICNSLTWEITQGELPVQISLRTGQSLEYWARLRILAGKITRERPAKPVEIANCNAIRKKWELDKTLKTRSALVNLRIESEMLIFIAQTGMNLQQVITLRLEQFHYTSHLDGYQVRSYKNRRQGEVIFEIYADYKKWLDNYLSWREKWFPADTDELLFPLIRSGGRLKEEATQFNILIKTCKSLGIPFIRPRELRGTRINWLLRESNNPHQVAELAQHNLETLIRVYADPHPQTAMVEIAKFHQEMDVGVNSPAPGKCIDPSPVQLSANKNAPTPDCINPSGCLFCKQHRDVESEDHVWSLASLKYLKSLELARYRVPQHTKGASMSINPAYIVVERLTAKLRFFEEGSELHKRWAKEAFERIRENSYHPAWDGFIQLAEGTLIIQK